MEPQPNKRDRALIYTRVSTEDQAGDDRQSLKTQRRICEKAVEDAGLIFASNGLYSDPGKSATNMNRPGLQDMLIRIQEDKAIYAVFVQDTDRLARNAADHLTIKALLRKHNVVLISVSQPGIKDDPEGRMMDLIVAGFNQFQSDLTSRKTIKSMEEKFSNGDLPTKAPIGYCNESDPKDIKKRIIATDSKRAPLVSEIFNLYATGDYSLAEVGDIVYRKGLLTKKGKRLAKSKLFELIRSNFYWGEMHWKGLVKIGNHSPLTTKEIFDRCQQVIAFNNRYACRRRKHDFLLRGFVFCKTCGHRHTAAHNVKKGKSYYYCSRGADTMTCSERYISVESLETQVAAEFCKIQFSDTLVQKITDRMEILYKRHREVLDQERKILSGRKSVDERQIENALQKLLAGVISDKMFTRIREQAEERIETWDEGLYEIDRKKNLKIDVIKETLKLIRNIGEAYQDAPPGLKRHYLGLFWERFVTADKTIVERQKTPLVLALEAMGSVSFQGLIKSPVTIQKLSDYSSVQIGSSLGAYRESNPN